jgi:hypothetical protein
VGHETPGKNQSPGRGGIRTAPQSNTKRRSYSIVAQVRLSLLGTEDRMDEDLGVSVSHLMPPLPGLVGIMTHFVPRLSPWATLRRPLPGLGPGRRADLFLLGPRSFGVGREKPQPLGNRAALNDSTKPKEAI